VGESYPENIYIISHDEKKKEKPTQKHQVL
jgi:hypothetical protein